MSAASILAEPVFGVVLYLRDDAGVVYAPRVPHAGLRVKKRGRVVLFKASKRDPIPSALGLQVLKLSADRAGNVRLAARARDVFLPRTAGAYRVGIRFDPAASASVAGCALGQETLVVE